MIHRKGGGGTNTLSPPKDKPAQQSKVNGLAKGKTGNNNFSIPHCDSCHESAHCKGNFYDVCKNDIFHCFPLLPNLNYISQMERKLQRAKVRHGLRITWQLTVGIPLDQVILTVHPAPDHLACPAHQMAQK